MRRRRLGALVALAGLIAEVIALSRRGYRPIGGNVVVACRDGHRFTTIWIPGVSLKAARLGWWRFQHCPVGHHWSLVTPLHAGAAASVRDIRIP